MSEFKYEDIVDTEKRPTLGIKCEKDEDERFIYTTTDRTQFLYAFNGLKYLICLWDLDQWFREQVKYAPLEQVSEEKKDAFEEARDKLREIMTDEGVSLEDLK
jgi:hypothetical protein